MALDPERLLMTLSGDLAGQGKRLDALEKLKLAERLGEMKEQLAAITAYLEQLAEEEPEEEPEGLNPAVVPDLAMLNSEQAEQLWKEILVPWLREVLYETYARPVWRPCWFKHPAVLEELIWLCAYWHWAYKVKGAPPTRASDWHTRCWPHVRDVLAKRFQNCRVPDLSVDIEALEKSSEDWPELTPEQRQQLAQLGEDRAARRTAAATARSTAPAAAVAAAERAAGDVRPKPLHALHRHHERDFADMVELEAFIAKDLAERREREAAEAAAGAGDTEASEN